MFLRKTSSTAATATATVLSTTKSIRSAPISGSFSTTAVPFPRPSHYPRCISSARPFTSTTTHKMPKDQAKETIASGLNPGEEEGELKTGEFKYRPPYRIHTSAEQFHAEWDGSCHCGKVTYQLSKKKPLKAKYCHCTTCQVLHAAPFQWAAIFAKDDINFTNGHESLTWYDSPEKKLTHQLPCKVSCSYCRTPIMDEGRNMILIYPGLIKGIEKKDNAEQFRPSCHMFYPQRLLDIKDGITKFAGLDDQSDILDDEGNLIKKWDKEQHERDQKAKDEQAKKKRKAHEQDPSPEDPKEGKL